MYRHIYQDLIQWKESKTRKPLILKGVRQCGKTWLLKTFAAEHFEDVAYFNFEGNDSLQICFTRDMNTERILKELGQIRHKSIDPKKTVVIFDEIQFCPSALTSLKYFFENMPELPIMCAGSLLGIALAKPLSSQGRPLLDASVDISSLSAFPVGKVTFLTLYPMDFSEFLLANGEEYLYNYLNQLDFDEKISPPLVDGITGYYRDYILVGGMPEAVNTWVLTHDVGKVDTVLTEILNSYEFDFAKHAPSADYPKLSGIWKAIPSQLAKENRKFIYSKVMTGGRGRNMSDALQWLVDAGLVYKIDRVERPDYPLSVTADSSYFKVYLCDVGLLRRLSRFDIEGFFADSPEFALMRGVITENFVLTELISSSGEVPFYWKSGNTAEVEFVVQHGVDIVPVEVKAGLHTSSKSLAVYREKYHPRIALRMSLKNVGITDDSRGRFISLPLYLAGKVTKYLH